MSWRLVFGVFLLLWLAPLGELHAKTKNNNPQPADRDPTIELSAMGSLSKTDFGNNTYSTSRHYTATAALHITRTTEIELSYANTTSFLNEDPVQTSTTSEQSLGLSIVQALAPPHSYVQPYVKVGAGQYNRQEAGTVSGIPSDPVQTKAPTAILGAGLKVYVLRTFALKGEAITYLPDFHMGEATDNFTIQVGVSWEF